MTPSGCAVTQGAASPVYSATEAREDVADAVSQSRSVLLLGLRLRMGKASRDSTLRKGKRGQGGTCVPSHPRGLRGV